MESRPEPNQQQDEKIPRDKINSVIAELNRAASDENPTREAMLDSIRRIRQSLRKCLENTSLAGKSEEEKAEILERQHQKFLKFINEQMGVDTVEPNGSDSTETDAPVEQDEVRASEK